MRLAVMQPYFLPYLGYFSLIAATDYFVVFDPVQYIRHGWINRNRILKPNRIEPQYIRIPLSKHSRETTIRDVTISDNTDWRGRIFRQLEHYRNFAPYFDQTCLIVRKCFEHETNSITRLNTHCLATICQYLEIPFHYSMYEKIQQKNRTTRDPGNWALEIATSLKADIYVNPIGGRDIFKPEDFADRNIELQLLEHRLPEYPQFNPDFIPALSIVDVLMFNDLPTTRELIDQYEIQTVT